MQIYFSAPMLAVALMFTCGSVAIAHSQQLQSDGTMSAPAQTQQAQAGQPHKMHNAAHQAKHLTKQLGLTPDQSAKLQPILADRDAQMATLHNDTTLDPRTMHKQGHAIELATESKINALLTPQQQQLYSDMRAAHQHGRGAPVATPPSAA